MFTDSFLHEEANKYKEYNREEFGKYISFLRSCKVNENLYTENHHILPEALYPQYSSSQENMIRLNGRDHFLAHYYLAKGIRNKSCIFAFNQMRRILKSLEDTDDIMKLSLLYEEFRKEHSKNISENNKLTFNNLPKERQEQLRKDFSERMKGKVNVRYPDGTTKRIPKDHEDYTSGLAVFTRVGYKHKEDTKHKMSNSAKMENKGECYTDGIKNVYLRQDEEIPAGFVKGSKSKGVSVEVGAWYYFPETNQNIRVKNGDEIPEGAVPGRISENNCFLGTAPFFNPEENRFELVNLETPIPKYFRNYISKNYFFGRSTIDNKLYFSASPDRLIEVIGIKGWTLGEICTNNTRIFKSSKNESLKKMENWKGKSFAELGFFKVSVKNFEFVKELSKDYRWV